MRSRQYSNPKQFKQFFMQHSRAIAVVGVSVLVIVLVGFISSRGSQAETTNGNRTASNDQANNRPPIAV